MTSDERRRRRVGRRLELALGDRERAGGAADDDHARARAAAGAGAGGAVTSVGGAVSPSEAPSSSPSPPAGAGGHEREGARSTGSRGHGDGEGTSRGTASVHRGRQLRRRLAAFSAATRTTLASYWRRRMRPSRHRKPRKRGPARARSATATTELEPEEQQHDARCRAPVTRLYRNGCARLEVVELLVEAHLRPPSGAAHSHSMVPGGLDVTSSTTRLTSRTSLVMRVEMRGEHVVGHAGPVGGHGVLARHRAQHDRVAVGAAVALHADRADVGQQHDRALPDVAVEPGGGQLLAGDAVGVRAARRGARG